MIKVLLYSKHLRVTTVKLTPLKYYSNLLVVSKSISLNEGINSTLKDIHSVQIQGWYNAHLSR